MNKDMSKIAFYSLIFFLLDQLSKAWIIANIKGNSLTLIPDVVKFHYSRNFGVAFSIPVPFILLIILNIVLLGVIIIFSRQELKTEKTITQIILALIIGGGIGNLFDRFVHGFVVDFISIWRYPIFNIADIFITSGVLLMLMFYSKINRTAQKPKNEKPRAKSKSQRKSRSKSRK